MLQTNNDVLTGDLELIAATLLEQLTPPVSPQQVELLAQAITGEVYPIETVLPLICNHVFYFVRHNYKNLEGDPCNQ